MNISIVTGAARHSVTPPALSRGDTKCRICRRPAIAEATHKDSSSGDPTARRDATVGIPQGALDAVDGEKRAQRAIGCIADGMALSSDYLLHELQDMLATDSVYLKATPRLRGFMRALAKRLEGAR